MIPTLLRNILTSGLRDAWFWRRTSRTDVLITIPALRMRVQMIDNLMGDCLSLKRSKTFRRLGKARERYAGMLLRLERRDRRRLPRVSTRKP